MSKVDTKMSSRSHQQGARYLCFNLGVEEYAIPLLSVREVIAVPEFTPVPFSPQYFLGIMNLRGQVISVIDLRQKLGIQPSQNSETAVIICDLAPLCLGLVVDSINSVISPDPQELSEKPDMPNHHHNEYITHVYRKDQRLVLVLDIQKALSDDDEAAMQRGTSQAA